MKMSLPLFFLALVTVITVTLSSGCSCGFNCSGNNNGGNGTQSAFLTLGFSDSLPEDLEKVVIEVDKITFQISGEEDKIIDRFTIDEVDASNDDTFQIDLLQYRGFNQLVILEGEEMDPIEYSAVFIDVTKDSDRNYVREKDSDTDRPLTVEDERLVLEGVTLEPGTQTYTVEFDLALSLQAVEGSNDYRLTGNGIRLVDNNTSATLSGTVDEALFVSGQTCSEKTDPQSGNRVYLYAGSRSNSELEDVFLASDATAPASGVAPFAVASLDQDPDTSEWKYAFGYLAEGSYTMAFACDTAGDDPVEWDDLDIPQPDDQIYPIEISGTDPNTCDLTAEASCP